MYLFSLHWQLFTIFGDLFTSLICVCRYVSHENMCMATRVVVCKQIPRRNFTCLSTQTMKCDDSHILHYVHLFPSHFLFLWTSPSQAPGGRSEPLRKCGDGFGPLITFIILKYMLNILTELRLISLDNLPTPQILSWQKLRGLKSALF